MGGWLRAALAAGLAVALGAAQAQSGIYTCVDAKGKRITSDRYIPDCSDREQKMLNSSGTVREVVPPTYTSDERDARDAQDRKKAEELQRQADEKRVLRALAMRYPNRAIHDSERAKALRSIDDATQVAQQRIETLRQERAQLQQELEFYRKDPAKMPGKLRRQLEENDQQVAAQQRFIAGQEEEKKRVNARFDEELVKLKPLWNPPQTGIAAAASASPAKP
jgi:hypothetical protein